MRQEDNSIIFFRIADHDNTERPVVLRNGCRCSCPRRIAYEHQCVHEMIFDGGLNLSKYNARRWYHQMDTATCNRIIDNISNHKDLEEYNPYGVNEDFGEDRSMFGDDQSSIQSLDSCTTKSNFKKLSGINFRTVSQKADTLIRFVQSDRTYLTDVSVLLDTLLERAWNKSSLRAHFDLGSMESSAARQNQPVHAIATSMKDPSKQKRKQSWYEIQNSRKKRRNIRVQATMVDLSNDSEFISTIKTNTKACSICGVSGHQRGKCPKILSYGQPLDIGKDFKSRQNLSLGLQQQKRFLNATRQNEDTRLVSETFPSSAKGVVIHRRLFETDSNSGGMCLEITVLGQFGDPMESFTNQLFSIGSVCRFITKSRSNIVICLLSENLADDEKDPCHELQTPRRQQNLSTTDKSMEPTEQLQYFQPNLSHISTLQQNVTQVSFPANVPDIGYTYSQDSASSSLTTPGVLSHTSMFLNSNVARTHTGNMEHFNNLMGVNTQNKFNAIQRGWL